MSQQEERRKKVPDSVTQVQFYDAMQALRDHIDQKHANQRAFIDERAGRIEKIISDHAKEDQANFASITGRVLVIETEREGEHADIIKRNSMIAAVISASAIVIWQIIKKALGIQ